MRRCMGLTFPYICFTVGKNAEKNLNHENWHNRGLNPDLTTGETTMFNVLDGAIYWQLFLKTVIFKLSFPKNKRFKENILFYI